MYPKADNIKELISYVMKLNRSLNYRFMAEKIDGEFKVTRLIIGAPKANWENYDYSDVMFRAGEEPCTRIANWLHGGRIHYDNSTEQFPIVPRSDYVNSSRHPSHSRVDLFTFPKTFTKYRIAFSEAVSSRNYDEFASEDAPFFFTLWEAERHILYDIPEASLSSVSQIPDPAIYVYIEHPGVWLERIHFSLTALEIHIGRDFPMRTKLDVIGSGIEEYSNYIVDENFVSIPLPDGRRDYIKIVLLDGKTWLDYFIDDRRLPPNPFMPKRDNVTFAEPEPQDKVRELIDRGEGRTIEFKAEISLSSKKFAWLKTVAAFANGEGGNLIIGVNDEDGSVIGINGMVQRHGKSISKFKDDIHVVISDHIDPVPECDIFPAHIDNQDILVIKVIPDYTKCYTVRMSKEVSVYTIRRGATTRIADNNEVQELVRLRTISQPQTRSPFDGYRFSQE